MSMGGGLLEAQSTPELLLPQVKALQTLPPPERQAVVAVYDFPDLTGQRKDKDGVASISTAVYAKV